MSHLGSFVQRFGSALQLTPHFHVLMPAGVFVHEPARMRFHPVPPPNEDELDRLLGKVIRAVVKLVRKHHVVGAGEPEASADPVPDWTLCLAMEAIRLPKTATRRVAIDAGLPPLTAKSEGFSLHADRLVHENDRQGPETLCRYGLRPAIAAERLSRSEDGRLVYKLKRTFSDGSHQVTFTPETLLRRIAALIPRPRVHLVRYHGVFAPRIRGVRARSALGQTAEEAPPATGVPNPSASPPFDSQPARPGRGAERGGQHRLARRAGCAVPTCFVVTQCNPMSRITDGGKLSDFGSLMMRLAGQPGNAGLLADFAGASDNAARFVRAAAPYLLGATADWTSERILLQLGLEHAESSPIGAAARAWLRDHPVDWKIALRSTPVEDVDSALIRLFAGLDADVWGATRLASGRLLSWASKRVSVHDLATGELVGAWEHRNTVYLARELADGHIASGAYDGDLHIWDPAAKRDEVIRVADNVAILAWAPWRDRGLVLADLTGELYLWRTGESSSKRLDRSVSSEALQTAQAFVVIDDLIIGCDAANILLWDLRDLDKEVRVKGHSGVVNGVLAIDDRRVLSFSDDHTLRLWDVRDGVSLEVLSGHTLPVGGAARRPGGGFLSWSVDGSVRTWSIEGRAEATLAHGRPVLGARALSREEVISFTSDGVSWWRGSDLVRSWRLARPIAAVPLAGGKAAVTAWKDPTIYVADAARGELARQSGHAGPVHGLEPSPDGRELLSWSADHTIRVWRSDGLGSTVQGPASRGAVKRAFVLSGDRVLTGHALGRIVMTGTAAGGGEIWSADVPGLEGMVLAGEHAVVIWSRERVSVRSLADGSLIAERKGEPSGRTDVRDAIALTLSRRAGKPEAVVWRIADGDLVSRLTVKEELWQGARLLAGGDAVLWSESGKLFRWDARKDRLIAVPIEKGTVRDVQVAGGQRVAVLTDQGSLCILAERPGTAPRLLAEGINGALADEDGRLVFWTSKGDLHFATPNAEAIERTVRGRGHRPAWVSLTPSGVVSLDNDGVVRYVSRSTTVAVGPVPMQTNVATADASLLAVACESGVDLYELPSAKKISRWQADGRVEIHGVTLDGRVVVTTSMGAVAAIGLI